MANPQKQYVLGRGKLYFDQFLDGTQTKTGERYIGNTPAFGVTSAYTNLDHYDADEGIRILDDTVQLQIDRTGTFQCDNISMENIAMMFGDAVAIDVEAGSTGNSATFLGYLGRYYQLGVTTNTPDGVGPVTNVVVTDNTGLHAAGYVEFDAQPDPADTITVNGAVITFRASSPATHEVLIGANLVETAQNFLAEINLYPSTYDVAATGVAAAITLRAIAVGTGGNSITMAISGTDPTLSGATLTGGAAGGTIASTDNYTVDLDNGRIFILDDSVDITDGDELEVTYDITAGSRQLVVDQQQQVEGALRFISANAKGPDKNYYWPRVRLQPSGEYQFKGDVWQVLTMNMTVLQATAAAKRVYVRSAVAV